MGFCRSSSRRRTSPNSWTTRNATIAIDLPAREIRGPDGGVVRFELDEFRKRCLIEGLDDIGLTMVEEEAIAAHEKKFAAAHPWRLRAPGAAGAQ
jgi:3-isopropylmalate dehydratase small subunit